MGATHFLARTPARIKTEMGLHLRPYNFKRIMNNHGIAPVMEAIRA